jgi:hypothetical protein
MASGCSDSNPAFDLGVRRLALIAPRGLAASSRYWRRCACAFARQPSVGHRHRKSGDTNQQMSKRCALQRKTMGQGGSDYR